MKVGILTFHAAHNFGAMLQAYALQEQIRINGHEPWIINYVPEYIASKRQLCKSGCLLMEGLYRQSNIISK